MYDEGTVIVKVNIQGSEQQLGQFNDPIQTFHAVLSSPSSSQYNN